MHRKTYRNAVITDFCSFLVLTYEPLVHFSVALGFLPLFSLKVYQFFCFHFSLIENKGQYDLKPRVITAPAHRPMFNNLRYDDNKYPL